MKAITVEPKKPGTARFEDVPEPEAREGSVLVEAVAVGVCGTDVEIVEGKYGWAPPGTDAPRARPRVPRPRGGPGPEQRIEEGRSRGRHRSPPRSGSLPELRRRRVGHVPERPLHRAGDQGDPRLHVRALAHRARVRDEGGPVPGNSRRASRADDGDREGAGAGRRGRPALLLGTEDGARDRRWSDRSPRGLRSAPGREGGPRPRSGRDGIEAGSRSRSRRDISLRERPGPRVRAGRHRRVHWASDR